MDVSKFVLIGLIFISCLKSSWLLLVFENVSSTRLLCVRILYKSIDIFFFCGVRTNVKHFTNSFSKYEKAVGNVHSLI